jgi:plasmid stabilization system protein ParE
VPRSGRIVPEIGRDSVREILEGNYRIVCLVGPSSIEILAVREGHRRLVVE